MPTKGRLFSFISAFSFTLKNERNGWKCTDVPAVIKIKKPIFFPLDRLFCFKLLSFCVWESLTIFQGAVFAVECCGAVSLSSFIFVLDVCTFGWRGRCFFNNTLHLLLSVVTSSFSEAHASSVLPTPHRLPSRALVTCSWLFWHFLGWRLGSVILGLSLLITSCQCKKA